MKSMVKFIWLTITLLVIVSNLSYGKTIIVKDTTMIHEDGTGNVDTLIISKNGILKTASVNLLSYCLIDSGGQLIGYPDFCWFAMDKPGISVINNSSDTAFKSVQFSLRANNSNTYLKGQYIIEFDKMFSGYGGRDVTMETDVRVNGSVFNGYTNNIYLNGNDLILGEDAAFEKLPLGQVILLSDPVKGGRVIKLIRNGLNTLIPFGDKYSGMAMRTDVNFIVNPSAVLGSNPAVIFEMFANDSLPLASDKIVGAATKDYLKRWLKIKFQNVSSPDITVRLNEAENGVDTVGVPSNYFCALWDGAKWNYQNPYNTYYKFTEWYNLTQQEAILSAGRDLGLSAATCNYQPTNIRFKNVGDNSAYMLWDKASSTDKKYNIKLRQKGTSPWTSLSANTNLDTLSGLTASTKYEIKIQTVCQNNDTSAFTAVKEFFTSVPNYDAATNTYSLSTYDTIPSFIEYTIININSGGVGVVVDDIRALSFLNIYAGGTLYMDDHYLYGTATPRLYTNSTLRYSQKYLKSSYDSPFRTGKTAAVQGPVSFILNGNNAEGQFIDASFLSTVNNLTIDAQNKVFISRDPIGVTGTFTFKNGFIEDLAGKINLSGDSLIILKQDAEINAPTRVASANYVITGNYPVKFNNFSVGIVETDPLRKVTLDQDVEVTSSFNLLNGNLVLNGHSLTLKEVTKDVGQVICEDAGTVNISVTDYSKIPIPFGNGTVALPAEFTLVSGTIGEDALISLQMIDTNVAEKGSAPVDYLTRYLNISLSDITTPVFNISFVYDSATDVVGTEAFMENEIYTGSSWVNSYKTIDSVNNKVYWNSLTETGKLTAGNYMGYTNPEPIDLSVNEVITDGATFNWVFLDEGVTNWTLKYKELSASTWTSVSGISGTSKRLTGVLVPATTYEWYVLTSQTAGYSFIDSSVVDTFTTKAGSCNQPVAVASTGQQENAITLTWDEGAPNFTVEYKKYAMPWDSAVIISTIADTFKTISGLTEQTKYVARIKSTCNEYSDTIIFNTTVRGLVGNVLTIDTVQNIPMHFIFDKIIIDSGGKATALENVTVNDSIIVRLGAELDMKAYVMKGFAFVADSLSKLYIGSADGIVDDDNKDDLKTIGNVQTTVRDYHRYATYVYNGTVAQQMHKIFVKDQTKIPYLVIDNPTVVKLFDDNLTISKQMIIEQGVLEMQPKKIKLTLSSDVIFTNNSGENALNNGSCYLVISGGAEGQDNGAIIQGTAVTYADTVVQNLYDEAYIKSDLRVGKFLGLAENTYYYGIRIIGAKLILDPGVTIITSGTRIMLMDTLSTIVYKIDTSVINKSISIPTGTFNENLPFTFKINNSVSLGVNPYISVSMNNSKHSSVSGSNYLNRYFKVNGNGISNLSYNISLSYFDADIVGTEKLMLSSFYDLSLWQLDTVNYSSNKIECENLAKWGVITASSGTKYLKELSPLPNITGVALDEIIKVVFYSQVTNVSLDGITIKNDMGDTVSGTSSSWDYNTRTLSINHDPFPDKDKEYTVFIPGGNVYVNTFTNPENITWSFISTGTPRVKTSVPSANETKVSIDSDITIKWDIDVDSINYSGIYLMDTATKTKLAITVLWNDANNTITIQHLVLTNYKIYKVFINDSAVKSDTLYNLEYSWVFRTIMKKPEPIEYFPLQDQSEIDPVDAVNSIYVGFNQDIFEADFSKAYVVDQYATILNLSKEILFDKFRFNVKNGDFDFNKTYTVIVPSGTVKNEEGVFNDSISWGFSMKTNVNQLTTGSFKVFPNPVADYLEVVLDSREKEVKYSVRDLLGVTHLIGNVLNTHGFNINFSDLPSGIYTVELRSVNIQQVIKVIKK